MRKSILFLGTSALMALGSAAAAQQAAPFLETPCGVSRPAPSCAFSGGEGVVQASAGGYAMGGGAGVGAGGGGGGAQGGGMPGGMAMGGSSGKGGGAAVKEDEYFAEKGPCPVCEAGGGETPTPSPVPVPAGLPLLLGGLALVAGARRFR